MLLVFVLACSTVGWDGAPSDHFDGRRFHNTEPSPEHGALDLLRWRLNRDVGHWPEWIDAAPGDPPPTRLGGGHLRVTFVGHATALLQMDGLNVLLDPVWSRQIGAFGVGPERHRPPGVRFEDLPPIDVVLLSHDHYDHLDLPTLRRLVDAHAPRILTGLGTAAYLESEGVPGAVALDWWDRHALDDGVEVIATPARHFSRRGPLDANRRLWVGFALRGPSGVVYYAGDTGYGAHFAEVRRRLGTPRLALLPIGAYRPRWFMCGLHMDPSEAAEAHRDLGAPTSVAVHWGTFALADEGETEPLRDLHYALRPSERERFWVLGHGEGREVPPGPADPAARP